MLQWQMQLRVLKGEKQRFHYVEKQYDIPEVEPFKGFVIRAQAFSFLNLFHLCSPEGGNKVSSLIIYNSWGLMSKEMA